MKTNTFYKGSVLETARCWTPERERRDLFTVLTFISQDKKGGIYS